MATPLRILAVLALSPLLAAAGPESKALPDPNEVVHEAMARADQIPAQAVALAELAWPRVPGDPRVAALAREVLVHFGEPGVTAMRRALPTVKPEQQAEVVKALLETFPTFPGAVPPDYVLTLEDVLWIGTREAKTLAIPELARLGDEGGVLPIIDSTLDEPGLRPVSIPALGTLGNERARFFLERMLHEGGPGNRELAAVALARIGGKAHDLLRQAVRSNDKEVRLAAVRAMLPTLTVDDLTVLHEYTAAHPDDDPGTYKAVTAAAGLLEKLLEAQQAADSASPQPQ